MEGKLKFIEFLSYCACANIGWRRGRSSKTGSWNWRRFTVIAQCACGNKGWPRHVAEAAGRKAEIIRVLMRCYKLTSDHVAGTAGREAGIKNVFNVTAHMCACAVNLRRSKTIFWKCIYLSRTLFMSISWDSPQALLKNYRQVLKENCKGDLKVSMMILLPSGPRTTSMCWVYSCLQYSHQSANILCQSTFSKHQASTSMCWVYSCLQYSHQSVIILCQSTFSKHQASSSMCWVYSCLQYSHQSANILC